MRRRGYEAYDLDDFAAFVDVITGEKDLTRRKADERTEEWRQRHEWKLPIDEVLTLRAASAGAPIFLCGVAANDAEFWNEFSKVFCLYAPPEEIERRLLGRPDPDDYGKNPLELAMALEWAAFARQYYEERGAVIVDAMQPVERIADAILDQTLNR
jgi:hypothetical protein